MDRRDFLKGIGDRFIIEAMDAEGGV